MLRLIMDPESTADVPEGADVPAEDFHQSAGRFRLLSGRGDPVRLLRAGRPGGRWAATLLEDGGQDGWFMWKGPAGLPDPELLSALLTGIAQLGPATLVLLPEWDFPEVLAAAGYRPGPPYATGLVPTGGGDEAILARMRPSTRSRVRRALRSGLEFADDPGRIDEFYDFYAPAMIRADSPDLAPSTCCTICWSIRRSTFSPRCTRTGWRPVPYASATGIPWRHVLWPHTRTTASTAR